MKLFILGMLFSFSLSAMPLENMQTVGQAKLKVLFWNIYQSWLYTPDGVFTPEQYPVALKIQYLRDISAADLLEATEEEWQKLGFKTSQYQPWLQQVQALWPDIKQQDELLLVIDQDQQSQFYFNQQLLGHITDPDFGPGFLAIWLSPDASYPKLRRQLIGEQ